MIRSARQLASPRTASRASTARAAAVCVALLMLMFIMPAAADTVRLQSRAWAQGPDVTLAQVAQLIGNEADALGAIVVARFEEKAESVSVTLRDVRRAMTGENVHWGRVSLQGFAACQVQRVAAKSAVHEIASSESSSAASAPVAAASPIMHGDTLQARIESLLVQLNGVPREQLVFTFREQDVEQLQRSITPHRFEIEPTTSSVLGRVALRVRRYEGERPVESFTLMLDVQRRVKALVATGSIGRDEPFNAGNVRVREVLLDNMRGQPMEALDDVLGSQAAGLLREGSVIYPDDVRSPVLVRRGELVTVRCMVGTLAIRTVGRSRDEGQKGDMIQVRNESSREMYLAQVTGRREVLVQLDASEPADASQTASRGDVQ